ncbi:MAG: dephospho-CoA kinase [Bacillota bacterium]|jgi:dephospho-CoA kinase|nr:dephospho-CoA kinase [Bacillota bacterium]HPZ54545.1 dephospho-CoA kinase [Bacillota bacterium]HQD18696.1 dephospho-CoA kinase [Bacillota bacterium]
MVVIGLTGGTASGKSTVAGMLARMGAHIIDADLVARELQEPGSDALKEIADVFGQDVINSDGTLNRRALGRICFSEREQLEKLNAIMHPRIKERIESQIRELKSACYSSDCSVSVGPRAIVIDAAVLFESGLHQLTDVVIAVVADPEVQVQRLVVRTGLSESEARDRVKAQRSAREFAALSDYVIDTTGGVGTYEKQVRTLFEEILKVYGS